MHLAWEVEMELNMITEEPMVLKVEIMETPMAMETMEEATTVHLAVVEAVSVTELSIRTLV